MSTMVDAPVLDVEQERNARIVYREGRRAGLPVNRARELVQAAWHESRLRADAINPDSGAAGLLQLLSPHYREQAERLGGLFDPAANVRAILPDYVAYWKRRPTARRGEAARDVERSGEGADWYARDFELFAWLTDTTAKATAAAGAALDFVFPVPGGKFRNDWGDPRGGGRRQHRGTDIFAPRGTEVLAPRSGTVSLRTGDAGGNAIWINGRSYLAHLESFAVAEGQKVEAGQVIGAVGSSGNAAGGAPHVHYGEDPAGTFGRSWENPYPTLATAAATAGGTLIGLWWRDIPRAAAALRNAAKRVVGKGKPAAKKRPGLTSAGTLGVTLAALGVGGAFDLKRAALWLLFALLGLALILLGVLRLLGIRPGVVVNVARGVEPT
jgi:murein DD-endopeptidase MepM/ murein hydrolase activator NlpD